MSEANLRGGSWSEALAGACSEKAERIKATRPLVLSSAPTKIPPKWGIFSWLVTGVKDLLSESVAKRIDVVKPARAQVLALSTAQRKSSHGVRALVL